jgi:hypothetical protein
VRLFGSAGAIYCGVLLGLLSVPILAQTKTSLVPTDESARRQQRPCTSFEASRAQDEAIRLKSWSRLHESFKRYGHCDDGAIAEGYASSVVEVLTHKWTPSDQWVPMLQSDKKFTNFVLNHISTMAEPKELRLIRRNAKLHSPERADGFCKAFNREAKRALKEQIENP